MTSEEYAAPGLENGGPKIRLGIMMFLQYAIWGIWLPWLGLYLVASTDDGGLGFTMGEMGWIVGVAGASGALVAPFIAGQIADRFLNAEIALGLLLAAGGVVNIGLAFVTEFWAFLILSIAYSVCYMPTISLTNTICFANLRDPETAFPRVRVWGTIGWIVAGAFFGLLYLQKDVMLSWKPWFFVGTPKDNQNSLIPNALLASGVITFLYAIYAFVGLPRTRPKKSVSHPLAFLEAFGLLRFRGVFIITVAALLISMTHTIYFMRTNVWLESIGFQKENIGALMSIGQIVEIFILAVLGFCLRGLGYRWVITLGAIAYLLRFSLFAWATTVNMNLAYIGIALHGFCFAFFFAAAFMFIDRAAPKDARHSAQTCFGIALLGVGPILAGPFNSWLSSVGAKSSDGLGSITVWWRGVLESLGIQFSNSELNWAPIWWTVAAIAAIAAILLLIAFTDDSRKSSIETD